MSDLCYDAVIATRNRPEALRVSLPMLVGQSRPPERLIVIDASDDHAAVRRVVAEATRAFGGDVVVEQAPAGLTGQRNRGLAYVTAPVVFFPDDDALFFPGAAAEMMAVYARDAGMRISAVCAAEASKPPQGAGLDVGAYRPARPGRVKAVARSLRRHLERRMSAVKPALFLGRRLNGRAEDLTQFADMDVVPVEYMTGFRMSFRTDAIRPTGFDETLGGYGLEEDVDASLTAMRSGFVVGARRAQVYHHRCPGGRGNAYARGRMEVLNRAYVLLKHASGPLGSARLTNAIWRRHLAFTALKLLAGVPSLLRADGRARMAGALAGHVCARRLWSAPLRDRAATLRAASV